MQNIVILGAGFGGLRAAMKLSKRSKWLARRGYQIILVDQNAYHTYTPTLYEIASTSQKTANSIELRRINTYPIEELLSGRGIQFRKDVVKNIDVRKGQVELSKGSLPYSHLIFALGSQNNYFDIDGLEKTSFALKSFSEALTLRDTFVEKAYSPKYAREFNVVICGAGPTGVELAAEFKQWIVELKEEGVRCNLKITLLDAAPQILSKFDSEVIRKAEKRLKKFGINILTKSMLEKVTRNTIYLRGDIRLRYDLLVWAGGVTAHQLTQSLPFRKSPRGIEVSRNLEAKLFNKHTRLAGKVYVIGDNAIIKSGRTLAPQMARPAISQGAIAANNIIRDIAQRPKQSFTSIEYPYVIPVGGKYAIVKIGSFVISGILGWILKGLIELNYLASIMPLGRALKIWYAGLIMFIKNDRLG